MARIARVVVPGFPHHVTQRGNRRQQTFFCDVDYLAYIDLMAEWCRAYNVAIWPWCLMPNHVHLIAVPANAEGLARAIGEAHRRYTRRINFREQWRGHLKWFPTGMIFCSCHLLMKSICFIAMNGQAALWGGHILSINSRPLFHEYCAPKNQDRRGGSVRIN
jgi:REP element-mobilizing transposase RayT